MLARFAGGAFPIRSRTMSEAVKLRVRDSSAIALNKDSGNLTVNVFMTPTYYIAAVNARHNTEDFRRKRLSAGGQFGVWRGQ